MNKKFENEKLLSSFDEEIIQSEIVEEVFLLFKRWEQDEESKEAVNSLKPRYEYYKDWHKKHRPEGYAVLRNGVRWDREEYEKEHGKISKDAWMWFIFEE